MDYITTIEMSKNMGEFHLEEFLFYVAREECLEQRKKGKDLANTQKDAVKPTDPRKKNR